MELLLTNEKDIQNHLTDIFNFAQENKIWLFVGEMGAGKTTTIKNICEQLEVRDEVSSPTFSIVNEYLSPQKGVIYHFDCYRIEDEDEAFEIGIEDYFYSGNLCFIEWPQKIESFIPEQYLIFNFEKVDESTRKLTITNHG